MPAMLLRGLRWGLAGVLVAWTVIRLLGVEPGWPLAPMLAATPIVAAVAVLMTLAALLERRLLLMLATGACALVLVLTVAPRVVPNRAPEDTPGARLRVLAANVSANPAAAPDVVALVRRLRPDVMAVLELPPPVERAYESAGIGDVLPERALSVAPGFAGSGLYARVPLEPLPGPRTHFATATAVARPRGAPPVELVAVHARAPTSASATRVWRDDLQALPGGGAGGPLRVLAGDFNATLDHAELRELLAGGYRDAAEQAGNGLRPTWTMERNLLPPLVTIDHVLADRRMRVASARVVRIPGSDHRGVLAELVLPDDDRGGG
jgi:endonuclease/exonuclease/phosphatase (EEP) superfamily protein YafD